MRIRTLVCSTLLGLAAACGGDDTSRDEAREQATARACARLDACDQVGSGRQFATEGDCRAQLASFWTDRWPAEACEDRMGKDEVDVCLESIDITTCGSGLSFLSTLAACSSEQVCTGGN